MSKGIEMNGRLRGKRGGVVYSVLKGEQVSRAWNDSPANPRSKSQMSQRVKLGAAVGFYKRTKNFFKFAFKKTQKQSDYNAFIKENINITPYLTKSQVLENVIVPAPYQMTRGELDLNQTIAYDVDESFEFILAEPAYPVSEATTINDLMVSMGAKIGDMITIYHVQSYADGGIAGKSLSRGWVKYTFKAEDLTEKVFGWAWDEAFNASTSMAISGIFGAQFSINIPGASATTFCCGTCLVLSRRIPGSPLMVSSSTMQLNELAQSTYEAYRTDAQLEVARNSYGASEDAFLVPETPSEH